MLVMRITIEEKHIKEAEQIFIEGYTFDKERIDFIKDLETCDLLAVPGSGKTTALMVKLYCLSQKLPFEDGSGILVLAHTNAAVNEIESKLIKHCQNLFKYPHFIGTIQSFVNTYLANPANFLKYGSYINNNDNDIYKSESLKFYHALKWKNTEPKNLINKLLGRVNIGKQVNFEQGKENIKDFLQYFQLDIVNRKIVYNDKVFYTFNGDSQSYYLEIEEWKESLFAKGISSFRDSFHLAEWYLQKFPKALETIQHRFKYVFIDEMQDLDNFQIEIIDKIFFSNSSTSIIQRIGDINQAIYNSGKKIKVECDWKTRESVEPTTFKDRYINGSNRLTKANADVVNCFTLDSRNGKFVVVGNKELGTEDIKPHLILFNAATKDKLKVSFGEIIKEYKLHEIEDAKHGFNIIGWTAEREKEGDGNMCLHTIFGFTKDEKDNKEDFDTLSKYLQLFNQSKDTLVAVRKSLLNALITILKLENCKVKRKVRGKDVERFYSKSEMIDYIKGYEKDDNFQVAYEDFKEKLFQWSFELGVKKKYEDVYNSIVTFLNKEFKELFKLSLTGSETTSFINSFTPIDARQEKKNDGISDELKIEIATVHSVKGQTHCATMYVETAYKTPVYETLKLKEEGKNKSKKKRELKTIPLFKQKHSCETPTGLQALKMMYVGFSRPTHLLCFAVLEENVRGDLKSFSDAGWEIKDLTSEVGA
jgi:DNA helicase-2/ATP-dependent DNA helicase PcrA